MLVGIIVAMDRRGLIGAGGGLPWHLPGDLRRFRTHTWGKPIIMGRKTFESLGRPLPGRYNIVLTQDREYDAAGCAVVHDFRAALSAADEYLKGTGGEECMVIGGGKVYAEAINCWDRLYLTVVGGEFKGNTYFPVRELLRRSWRLVGAPQTCPADQKNQHSYTCYQIERVPTIAGSSAGLDGVAPADLPEVGSLSSGTTAARGVIIVPAMCEIRLCQGATTEQLKALGKALSQLFARQPDEDAVLYSINKDDIEDLLSGEPPQPLALRALRHAPGVDRQQVRQDFGSLASDRSLRFPVKGGHDWPPERVARVLRQALPFEPVEDLLVNDRSLMG